MANNRKQSTAGMASKAGKILGDKNSSAIAKSLAASVIAQSHTSKQTGADLETVASKVLQSEKYGDNTKQLAASVLSQSKKDR